MLRQPQGRRCVLGLGYRRFNLGLADLLRLGFGQVAFDQSKVTLVELRRGHGLAGDLDHRIITGADRHRNRTQYTHAKASGGIGLLEGVAVLQRVGEHGRTLLVTAVGRAGHAEADLQVVLAVLLEAFVTGNLVGAAAGDDVTLAQQRTPGSLARAGVTDREAAREGARVIEVLMLIDSGFFRGATGHARQHQGQPERTKDG
ncbi:hypothetical protein D3C81_1527010 [compost metagenome]